MSAKWYFFLVLLLVVPFIVVGYNHPFTFFNNKSNAVASIEYDKPIVNQMEPGAEFDIQKIYIEDGYRFKILLSNGKFIEAHLTRATKDKATETVISILETGERPSIILRRKVEKFWIADIHLNIQNERYSLVHLLEKQGLTY